MCRWRYRFVVATGEQGRTPAYGTNFYHVGQELDRRGRSNQVGRAANAEEDGDRDWRVQREPGERALEIRNDELKWATAPEIRRSLPKVAQGCDIFGPVPIADMGISVRVLIRPDKSDDCVTDAQPIFNRRCAELIIARPAGKWDWLRVALDPGRRAPPRTNVRLAFANKARSPNAEAARLFDHSPCGIGIQSYDIVEIKAKHWLPPLMCVDQIV